MRWVKLTLGSPWENGYNESFNGKLRDECLNMEIFYTLKEAQVLIEQWRCFYNTQRPHSALGSPTNRLAAGNTAGLRYQCGPARLWSVTMPDSNSGTGPPKVPRSLPSTYLGTSDCKHISF